MTKMHDLIARLPDTEECYYFGSTGFNINSKGIFEKSQLGYRTHPDGSNLASNKEGDWSDSWFVIGRDTLVGDPFFVDINSVSLPVYTAMHGQGSWKPELVSDSLSGFLTSIKCLSDKSKQEAELIEPDENTISDENELDDLNDYILSLCGKNSEFFWECFFEQHQDWIIENED